MKRSRWLTPLSSLVLLLAAAACTMTADAPAAAQPDEAAIRAAIEAREAEWSAAYAAGDAMAVAAIYAEDGAQIEPDGEWVRGREAIAASMRKELDTIRVTKREDATEEVIVAGDYVIEFGRYHLEATTVNGNKPFTRSGRYMALWHQGADGVWRIHRDMGSPAAPPKP